MSFNSPVTFLKKVVFKKDIMLIKSEENDAIGEISYLEGLHPPFNINSDHSKILKQFDIADFDKEISYYKLPIIYQFLLEQLKISRKYSLLKSKESSFEENNYCTQALLFTNTLNDLDTLLVHWQNKISKNKTEKVKIKLGLRSTSDEIYLLKKLVKIFPKTSLRLDFNNREVCPDDYSTFIEKNWINIDYLESPPKSLQNKKYPQALDLGLDLSSEELKILQTELIKGINIFDLKPHFKNLHGIVLKPSFVGLSQSIQLAEQFFNENIQVTLSASYESTLALSLSLYQFGNYFNKKLQEYTFHLAFDTWAYVANPNELVDNINRFSTVENKNFALPKIIFGPKINLIY